jgi:hypothetical protein
MNKLKKIWDALNGSKTTIGMVIMLISQGLKVFAPNFITPDQLSFLQDAGAVIGGVGLAHKGLKNNVVQNSINKIKK